MIKEKEKTKTVTPLLNPALLRRNKPVVQEEETEPEPAAVSAGAVDKVIDLAFNPSRDKIREVTVIDRLQGRFFPQLDMINSGLCYCIEIATLRQSASDYRMKFKRERPLPPNLIDELLYRIAQWQKSVAGKNLERAIDIALAETETKSGEEEPPLGGSNFSEG